MTNRRDFLIQSAALVSTSLITLPVFSRAVKPKYKMGLQLFTVRDALAKDLQGSLKKIAALGYEDLETYGYNGAEKKFYGLDAPSFRNLLADNKLTTSSGHYDFAPLFDKPADELKRYVDQCIEGAHAVGHHYITWPWLNESSRSIEKFKLLTEKLNLIGEQVNKAKLGFAYHNHDFEFIDHNGENGYDIILKDTDPSLVKLQIDLYWTAYSKRNPLELFAKYPGRFVMWHIKDMDKVSRNYTEMGNGSVDYTTILPSAAQAGLQYYFIEQGSNFAQNSMQSIADSAAYFNKNLRKYLN